jgi:hypothetical protein
LDSTLAVKVILDQGVKVTALRFLTSFGCDAGGSGSCGHDVSGLAKQLGFEIKLCHLGDPYIDMVKRPKFGRGDNMNPCVDCRIMMLTWAGEYMRHTNAAFVFTGEVLNQRPMSQTREKFRVAEKETGLTGRILRPLSAKLLAPTTPELEGIVDREKLLEISGRSRKPQIELARQWGITDFGQPAGGCLLTDPGYSARLKELWDHDSAAGAPDIALLRVGRHFRLTPACKAIVGRDEEENGVIESMARTGDALLTLRDHVGPSTLVRGTWGEDELRCAAGITVRYGDSPRGIPVHLFVRTPGGPDREVEASALEDSVLDFLRVGVVPPVRV